MKDSDALYRTVAAGLQRGEGPELLEAASSLMQAEGPTERAVVACALVLMRSGQLDAARAGLEGFLSSAGETPAVLTNLAKVEAEAGDELKALATVRRALEKDPDYDGAVRWWAALLRKHSDDEGWRAALEGLGGWRAKLLLADGAFRSGDDAEAQRQLAAAVQQGGGPAMVLAAQRLHDRGAHQAVVMLLGGWNPKVHGSEAGAQLMRAQLELGLLSEARTTLKRLPRRDSALEQRLIEAELLKLGSPEIRSVPIFAPLWASVLPEAELPPLSDAPRVALMTFSDVTESDLCRSFPLAMSDAIRATGVESFVVLPVVKGRGLVGTAQEWTFERALRLLPPRHLPKTLVLGRFVAGLAGEQQLELDLYDLASPGKCTSLRAFGRRSPAEVLTAALKQLERALQLPMTPQAKADGPWLTALGGALPVFLVGSGAIDAQYVWHATRGLEMALAACLESADPGPRLLAVSLFVSGMRLDLPGFEEYRAQVLQLTLEPRAPRVVQKLEALVRTA